LLERRAADRSERRWNSEQRGVTGPHIAVERVRDRADEGDQADRSQGCRHRRPLGEPREQQQERHHHDSAADTEERAEEAGRDTDQDQPHLPIVRAMEAEALLARLNAEPDRAAILLDVDGVLAPIQARPEQAHVPPAARTEVERLAARYALVACISGRTGDDARRMVGVEGVVYVGAHGLELEPEAAEWSERIREFGRSVDWPVEDKGLTVSFHYREAEDEEEALEYLREVADRARAAGLVPRFGRKVLELRPPIEAHKGTAVRRLLAERDLSRALYAGDDTTDVDAFRALEDLELGIRVAVSSDEAPDELVDEADVVVDSPAAVVELLQQL
jgi:trehalose 6-phosphate phosphatase